MRFIRNKRVSSPSIICCASLNLLVSTVIDMRQFEVYLSAWRLTAIELNSSNLPIVPHYLVLTS